MPKIVLNTKDIQEVLDDIESYLSGDPIDDQEWEDMVERLDRIQFFLQHILDVANGS